MDKNRLRIGCIADDFTGGSDIASFIASQGIKTLLLNGTDSVMPEPDRDEDIAVVLAMKTRSISAEEARKQTSQALEWLDTYGAEIIYQKYCSTFDSTPDGNIGPVADMILERYDLQYTVLCPSLIANGRSVRDGVLYVGGVPLAESSMRYHPLNPMWASELKELMKPQSKYPVFTLPAEVLADEQKYKSYIGELCKTNARFYLVPDYETEEQGDLICKRMGNLRFFTGGSGLAGRIAKGLAGDEQKEKAYYPLTVGKTLILSGSCSVATTRQIEAYRASGAPCISIDPGKLACGEITPEIVLDEVEKNDRPALVHSAPPDDSDSPQIRMEKAAQIEHFMAELAYLARNAGYRHFICAGGETSGAVMNSLKFNAFYIGKSIAPGVPVMIPVEQPEVRLVLKSGNFGQETFFEEAIAAVSPMRPLTAQERSLPYAKFYYIPVDMPSAEEEETFRTTMSNTDAIEPERFLDCLTKERNPAAENRHYVFDDGTIYAHTATEMPDLEGPMLGWWFSWFMKRPDIEDTKGNLRYRLWDPYDHWDSFENIMVESFDDGASGHIYYTDHMPLNLDDLGVSAEKQAELKQAGVMASGLLNRTQGFADRVIINITQPLQGGGFLTRSHYWFNRTLSEGECVRDEKKDQFDETLAMQIHRHNLVEKRHLNKILPALFAECAGKE